MSKQEKLAAFLEAFGHFNGSRDRRFLEQAVDAYDQWRTTPDDPPQPPEMPEVVRDLLTRLWTESFECDFLDLAKAVEAHYRQPLKLEVGKVYEDEHGERIMAFWRTPASPAVFSAVIVETGCIREYTESGKCLSQSKPNLIRRIS